MNRDLRVERLDMTLSELLRRQPFQWHGVKLNAPDWGHESHTLAATVRLLGYPEAVRRYVSRCAGWHLQLGRCSEAAGLDLPGSAASVVFLVAKAEEE